MGLGQLDLAGMYSRRPVGTSFEGGGSPKVTDTFGTEPATISGSRTISGYASSQPIPRVDPEVTTVNGSDDPYAPTWRDTLKSVTPELVTALTGLFAGTGSDFTKGLLQTQIQRSDENRRMEQEKQDRMRQLALKALDKSYSKETLEAHPQLVAAKEKYARGLMNGKDDSKAGHEVLLLSNLADDYEKTLGERRNQENAVSLQNAQAKAKQDQERALFREAFGSDEAGDAAWRDSFKSKIEGGELSTLELPSGKVVTADKKTIAAIAAKVYGIDVSAEKAEKGAKIRAGATLGAARMAQEGANKRTADVLTAKTEQEKLEAYQNYRNGLGKYDKFDSYDVFKQKSFGDPPAAGDPAPRSSGLPAMPKYPAGYSRVN